jgi:excisionase family DNA binding protein
MHSITPKIRKFCRTVHNEEIDLTAPCSVATIIERHRTLLTPQVLAELLAVSTQVVYLWVKTGRIPSTRIGTSIRFDPLATADWLRAKSN